MKKFAFIFLLLANTTSRLWSQPNSPFDKVDLWILTKNYALANAKLDSLETALTSEMPIDSASLATVWHLRGRIYYDQTNLQACIEVSQKALNYRKHLPDKSALALTHHLLGLAHTELSNYEQALRHHKAAEALRIGMPPEWRNHIGFSWHEIGRIYALARDFAPAFDYFYKALDTLHHTDIDKMPKKSHEGLLVKGLYRNIFAKIYNNIGALYASTGSFDAAILYYHKFLNALPPNDSQSRLAGLTNLGGAYAEADRIDSAKIVLLSALKLLKNTKEEAAALQKQGLYQSLAAVYEKADSRDTAKFYYLEAAHYGQKIFGLKHPAVLKAYRCLGQFHQRHNDLDSIYHYLAVISELMDTIAFPKHLFFEEYMQIDALRAHAAILTYQKTGNISYLLLADSICAASDKIYQKIISDRREWGSRVATQRYGFFIFDQAITSQWYQYQISRDSKHLAKAFEWSEKMKSRHLLEVIRYNSALQKAGTPDSLYLQERLLYSQVVDKEIKLYEIEKQSIDYDGNTGTRNNARIKPDSLQLNNLYREIEQIKRKHQDIKNLLQQHFPNPVYPNQDAKPLPVEGAMHLLAPDETLVSYVLGAHCLFIIVVKQGSISIDTVSMDEYLLKVVRKITNCMSDSNYAKDQVLNNYVSAAVYLYQKLITPVEAKLSDKLLILPDKHLFSVPFDVLLEKQPDALANMNSYKFLLYKKSIRYCYSASLLAEIEAKKAANVHTYKYSFAGFAPFSTEQTGSGTIPRNNPLTELPYSGKQIEKIGYTLKSNQIFKSSTATIKKFKEVAPLSKVVLLTTHAKANYQTKEYSYLDFKEEKLYLKEFCELSLPVDFLLLDACYTAAGHLEYAEGNISLNWGGVRTGASSIVTNLWSADDQAAYEIMTIFIGKWATGKHSKSEALRAAKLEYLRKSKNTYKHPYFWGNAILFGNNDAYTR